VLDGYQGGKYFDYLYFSICLTSRKAAAYPGAMGGEGVELMENAAGKYILFTFEDEMLTKT